MTISRPIRKIAFIGEVMIELAVNADSSARIGIAGDTFNSAVYLARALRGTGIVLSYVTALGRDMYSDRIFAEIERHGLDTSHIERRDHLMPGLYAINTDTQGERYFSYWRSNSAARTLFSDPCEVSLDTLDEFDLVYFSGISVAILPPPVRELLQNWIDQFRAEGGIIAYDSNYRPSLWSDAHEAREVNRQMWLRTDIALPSADDEMSLFGDQNEAGILDRLTDYGITLGALKRGARGPLSIASRVSPVDLSVVETVVDSTAAGDSFNAGYLAALIQGKSEMIAIREGHRLACMVVQSSGAIVAG